MNRDNIYSVIILKGTQIRRFAISRAGIRRLLWAGLFLLALAGALLNDYIALQKQKLQEVIAEAEAQREKVSGLSERTQEVRELLGRWKAFRERIQTSLPRRFKALSDGREADEELHEILGVLQSELKQLIAAVPSQWPVRGRIVSGVGMRASPWTGEEEFHSGLDIAQPIGTPVHAPGDAVVEAAGKRGGKGLTVILDHGQNTKTLYAHLSETLVKEGERVRKGQRIALVGNTGKSTGPHLHYEVRINGIAIDPRRGLIETAQE